MSENEGIFQLILIVFVTSLVAGSTSYIAGASLKKAQIPALTVVKTEPKDPTSPPEIGEKHLSLLNRKTNGNFLQSKEKLLSEIFSNSEIGHSLVSYTALSKFRNDVDTEEVKLLREQSSYLRAHPQETYLEIRQNIGKLGTRFSAERDHLIEVVGALDISNPEKVEFLGQAIRSGDAEFKVEDFTTYSSIHAFDTLINLSEDPIETDRIVNSQFASLQNPHLKSFLRSLYLAAKSQKDAKSQEPAPRAVFSE